MISITEYKERRKRLAKLLPQGAIAIVFAASLKLRNGDVHYKFRQDSNFYYLTGFNEPDAILVIDSDGETSLFNKKCDELEEQWNGRVLGQDDASCILGVDFSYPIDDFNQQLTKLLVNKKFIYYDLEQTKNWQKYIFPTWQALKKQNRHEINTGESFVNITPYLSEMRLIKSKSEVNLMRKAQEISIYAHLKAMRQVKKLQNESELEAELLYELQRLGCRNVAYEPIVAAGENACTLHYINNDKPIYSESLILIDAGGEFANYAADITRVFPASGKFSKEQREIYNLVLKAQRSGIALIKPGCRWDAIQKIIIEIITTGLVSLEILTGNVSDLIKNKAYQQFYMHGSGHWLGLDVHDCGSYKVNNHWRKLESGMVLTVEPGIYIKPGHESVDKRWHGIGVRIEDDILVTDNGYENLTKDLPVEVDDIEAYMRG